MWLVNRLNPRLDLECIEFDYNGNPDQHISMYRIPAATGRPVTFLNIAYIRIGSLTKEACWLRRERIEIVESK